MLRRSRQYRITSIMRASGSSVFFSIILVCMVLSCRFHLKRRSFVEKIKYIRGHIHQYNRIKYVLKECLCYGYKIHYHGGMFVSNDIFRHGAIRRSSVTLFAVRNIITICINVISSIPRSMHFGVYINRLDECTRNIKNKYVTNQ